jgi:predicted urease superfamily metal-dependent hydrolase
MKNKELCELLGIEPKVMFNRQKIKEAVKELDRALTGMLLIDFDNETTTLNQFILKENMYYKIDDAISIIKTQNEKLMYISAENKKNIYHEAHTILESLDNLKTLHLPYEV